MHKAYPMLINLMYVCCFLYQVTIEGEIETTGQSYVPVKAYMFIHVTQVSFNGKTSFNAVANHPEGKAADENGSSKEVSGSGQLNVVSKPETNVLQVETRSAKLEVVPVYKK